MGMFSSLFGSAGSDKADKMRQSAIDAFDAIKTPELSALQVQLSNYVNAGKLTPEQAEATLLKSNAFDSIKTDPSLTGAAKQALNQLQKVGTQGGMDAIAKAQLGDISAQQAQEAKSSNDAILENAKARGMGGSDLTAVNQLISNQSAADRASRSGTQVAADAQTRALQALSQAGNLGQSMEAQEYGEKANKANAANAIEQFNAQTQNAINQGNVNTANTAQAVNLQNAQDVANKNTDTANTNKIYNAQQNQTVFQDEASKAAGKAGVFNQWANDATAASNKEQAGNLGLVSGALSGAAQVGGFMAGGPAGGAAAGAMTDAAMTPSTNSSYKRNPDGSYNFAEGGEVPTRGIEDEYSDFVKKYCYGGTVKMADGGVVHIRPSKKSSEPSAVDSFLKGGKVPGHAPVMGDSPKNDVVPAKLSPGEIVLPRSVVQHPEAIPSFVKHVDPTVAALERLKNPNREAR